MTELTIDQALQQAIEAHKAGKVQQADRLYTAILKAQPKHPDANHNMGVLAIGVGKVEHALPFFKTALEANPATAQFWLSYIDALIKFDQLADAKAVLDQARSKGAKGDSFDKLEQRLKEASEEPISASKITTEVPPQQSNILDSLNLEQALKLAKKKTKEGSTKKAKRVYQDILTKFPENKRAADGIRRLAGKTVGKVSKVQDPPQDQLQPLVNLYSQGQFQQALKRINLLLKRFPNSFALHYTLGAVCKNLDQLDTAIKAYNKALTIKPNHAGAYYNMGISFKEQGKLEEAINSYRRAIAIKTDYFEAYNNMGNIFKDLNKPKEALKAYNKALSIYPNGAETYYNCATILKEQNKLEEAIKAYKKAIAIKPDYFEAHNNLGNVFSHLGNPEEAMKAYNKALDIKPDDGDVIENSLSIAVQLCPTMVKYGRNFDSSATLVAPEILCRPKYQIHNAIKAYLVAEFSEAHSHEKSFKASDPKLFGKLCPKDKVFCSTYSRFLEKLLETSWDNVQGSGTQNNVYHLGESHCLSYAHRIITLNGLKFKIVPRLTFGAKAFHFSCIKYNIFKAITEANFVSLPKKSKVFLSFGEIDCRPNEGFICASRKIQKPIKELIMETVMGYVRWFLQLNAGHSHDLYFINVPAPVYNKQLSADLNSEVAMTVKLFNAALKKYSEQHGANVVNVFGFTANANGFSNGLFHIDNFHLGSKALSEIEQQLT